MLWAVFQRNYRISKKPLTEYEARNEMASWGGMLSNLEVREIEQPTKPAKKRKPRRRMCSG
jgi:hypothetical protein